MGMMSHGHAHPPGHASLHDLTVGQPGNAGADGSLRGMNFSHGGQPGLQHGMQGSSAAGPADPNKAVSNVVEAAADQPQSQSGQGRDASGSVGGEAQAGGSPPPLPSGGVRLLKISITSPYTKFFPSFFTCFTAPCTMMIYVFLARSTTPGMQQVLLSFAVVSLTTAGIRWCKSCVRMTSHANAAVSSIRNVSRLLSKSLNWMRCKPLHASAASQTSASCRGFSECPRGILQAGERCMMGSRIATCHVLFFMCWAAKNAHLHVLVDHGSALRESQFQLWMWLVQAQRKEVRQAVRAMRTHCSISGSSCSSLTLDDTSSPSSNVHVSNAAS